MRAMITLTLAAAVAAQKGGGGGNGTGGSTTPCSDAGPVTVVVPYSPSGNTDVFMRHLAPYLGLGWGKAPKAETTSGAGANKEGEKKKKSGGAKPAAKKTKSAAKKKKKGCC